MKKTLIAVAAAASATVMQNEGICRPFLERMLGIGIEKIVYLEREKGLPVYTFENMCDEYEGLPLNDKCRKVFYNVNAWERENNPERRSLLKYFSDKKAEDDLTRCMQEQVVHTRNLREWRKEHMTLEER